MNTILIVLMKELKRYFTDVRMLIGLIFPGLLIFFLYTFMGYFMAENINTVSTDFNIVVSNSPVEFASFYESDSFNIELLDIKDEKEIFEKIQNKEIDLYIVYENNFYSNMLAYQTSSSSMAPEIKMYYNSTSTSSETIYSYYTSLFNAYESSITNKFDINISEGTYNLAKSEDVTMQMLTMMLPFLLIVFLFSGCMGICSDSIAGEKERGTIATLLITPANRSHIAIGKIISLSITSLVSALASFLGLILSLPNLINDDSISLNVYGIDSYMLLLLVIISTVFIFVGILTIISTIAKNVKEATSYSVIINLLVMVLGVTSFMGTTAEANSIMYIIPAYNSIQSLTAILSGSINALNLSLTIISNLVYTSLFIYLITKMFNNEKIMFNK